MMKKYKVHTDFDLDYITQEDPCRCNASQNNIFTNMTAASAQQLEALHKYNKSMDYNVFSADDVHWGDLTKSECKK